MQTVSWSALLQDEEVSTPADYTVSVYDLTEAEAKALLAQLQQQHPNAVMTLEQ